MGSLPSAKAFYVQGESSTVIFRSRPAPPPMVISLQDPWPRLCWTGERRRSLVLCRFAAIVAGISTLLKRSPSRLLDAVCRITWFDILWPLAAATARMSVKIPQGSPPPPLSCYTNSISGECVPVMPAEGSLSSADSCKTASSTFPPPPTSHRSSCSTKNCL